MRWLAPIGRAAARRFRDRDRPLLERLPLPATVAPALGRDWRRQEQIAGAEREPGERADRHPERGHRGVRQANSCADASSGTRAL
jgi:hypothetical protein